MKQQTKFEKDLAKKYKAFLKKQGWTESKLLNHPNVKYSNIEHFKDFLEGRGIMTSRVIGRIEAIIEMVDHFE